MTDLQPGAVAASGRTMIFGIAVLIGVGWDRHQESRVLHDLNGMFSSAGQTGGQKRGV